MLANMMLMLNMLICSSLVGRNIEYYNNDSVDIGRDDGDDDNVVAGLDDEDYVDNDDGDDFAFSRFVAGQVSGIEGWPRSVSSQVQRLVEFLPDFASIGKIGQIFTIRNCAQYSSQLWSDHIHIQFFLFVASSS